MYLISINGLEDANHYLFLSLSSYQTVQDPDDVSFYAISSRSTLFNYATTKSYLNCYLNNKMQKEQINNEGRIQYVHIYVKV